MTLINYAGVDLDIHPLLAEVWPYDLPFEEWPSYCGAGSGVGDWLITERPCGVVCSCLCADHDIRWSVAENSKFAALQTNFILYKNLRAFIWKHCDKSKYSKAYVETVSLWWFRGVCWGMWFHFDPIGGEGSGNAETVAKLNKLNDAVKNYSSKAVLA